MSAEPYLTLIERCEGGERCDQAQTLLDAFELLRWPRQTRRGPLVTHHPEIFAFEKMLNANAFESAALSLLPPEGAWRKLTDGGPSVYAASPYNAASQVRHDGNSPIFSLGMVAAILRMAVAPILKKAADEARRTGAVSR